MLRRLSRPFTSPKGTKKDAGKKEADGGKKQTRRPSLIAMFTGSKNKNEVTAFKGSKESKDSQPSKNVPSKARRQSAQLDAADRIFDDRGRRPSTFNMISAPPGRVIVVPAGGATTKLAMSQNMELFELKDIIFIFQKFDDDGNGALDLVSFEAAVASIFDLPPGTKVETEKLNKAWEESEKHGIEGFLSWYKTHQFVKIGVESASDDASVDQIAKKYRLDVSQVMKLKKKFDEFDADKSGEIDQEEFKAMLVFFMKVKNIDDIPAPRIKRFWQEIDIDQSGAVSFSEYVHWLSKTFPDYVAGGSASRDNIAAKSLYSNSSTKLASRMQNLKPSKQRDSKEQPSK